ncbi:hypothetical protein MRX96_049195 [Rhipicephalus microplus]
MSRPGQNKRRMFLFAVVASVVLETTFAWFQPPSSCGRNQQEVTGAKRADTSEKYCGRDSFNGAHAYGCGPNQEARCSGKHNTCEAYCGSDGERHWAGEARSPSATFGYTSAPQ